MLIGISGRARAGKDTLRNWLLETHGGLSLSYADKLRALVYSAWGREFRHDSALYGPILQHIGTEGFRAMDSIVWIGAAVRDALAAHNGDPSFFVSKTEHVIFADLRFQNEVDFIRIHGGPVIRLEVTPEQQRERGEKERVGSTHKSEQGGITDWKWFNPPFGLTVGSEYGIEDVQAIVRFFLEEHFAIKPKAAALTIPWPPNMTVSEAEAWTAQLFDERRHG